MGKAAIINPYLDTMGGGERYTFSFSKVLSELGYTVDIEWETDHIKKTAESRFGIDLGDINFKKDLRKGEGYDLTFWVSDGSVPLLHSRNNILHFQVPFHNVDGRSLLNKMKLFRINKIVCNSKFTKNIIDKEFGVDSVVIYPPVSIENFKPKRKQNILLFVGRFSNLLQNKGQEILLSAFKKMDITGWKLILAGGNDVGESGFTKSLKEMAKGYDVDIKIAPNFNELKDLYGRSKIFWSASGFGIDQDNYPEKLEHFGMTVVEAMSAGCVPIIYNAGGHKEILENGVNGYLWDSIDDLCELTNKVAHDKNIINDLSKNAIKRSSDFDYAKFRNSIKEIL